MSSEWLNCSKHPIIIGLSSSSISKIVVGFIDFDELFMSLFVVLVVFWMILHGQGSVGFFDFFKTGIFWYSQDRIVVDCSIRIVFFEELLLVLVNHSMFIKEIGECLFGILKVEFLLQKTVIVASVVPITEAFIGLGNIIKFLLSNFSVLFVFIGMPPCCELLIGILDVKDGGIVGDFQYFVVVFEICLSTH